MGNFLIGLGVGITMGVLFAPKSGEETRGLISKQAGEVANDLKRRSQELRDSAMDMVDRGKGVVRDKVERFVSSAQETGREVYQR